MYSRGYAVERNLGKALRLWERSLEVATSPAEVAQPAIRIAPLLIADDAEAGAAFDPMRALQLFNMAEIGLRLDIAEGAGYYRKRLEQAIEGQAKARKLLDDLLAP